MADLHLKLVILSSEPVRVKHHESADAAQPNFDGLIFHIRQKATRPPLLTVLMHAQRRETKHTHTH